VMLIQGVSILDQDDNGQNSVVYSRRSLEIGGGLVKTESVYNDVKGQTTRHVNSTVDGVSYGYAPNYANYFPITCRYSQILYNTDIILLTPDGVNTPRQSRIFDASLPTDGEYGKNNTMSDVTNKKFSPTVKIIGGQIYVGAGQTLTIDGGRINPLNGEKTQEIKPDSITVAEGGTLVIRGQANVDGTAVTAASAYANVDTTIYVEGTLNLETGARLAGTVYCYGAGIVNVNADVQWDGEDTDGIVLYGGGKIYNNVNAADTAHNGTHKVCLADGAKAGTGVVHYTEFGSGEDESERESAKDFVCDASYEDGLCAHYGGAESIVYIVGDYYEAV